MGSVSMWTILVAPIVLSVFPFTCALDKIDPSKCGTEMTDDLRSTALKELNDLRSTVAKGDEEGNYTYVPSTGDMIALVYNCDLEEKAKKQTENGNGCEEPHTPLYDLATNYKHFFPGPGGAHETDALTKALTAWKNQINDVPKWFRKNMYNSSLANVSDYANAIRANTSQVGCFEKKCNGGPTAVCCIFDNPQIEDGVQLFSGGDPCPYTPCDSGTCNNQSSLCVVPIAAPSTASTASSASTASTAPTTTTTARNPYDINCPGNTGPMTVAYRQKALDMTNWRRGQLAAGQVQKNNGVYMPKAANMLSLRYNCDLETAAQTEANKCGPQGTGAFGTENFYRIGASGLSVEQALGHSIRYWWKQVRLVPGIGVNLVTFKPKHRTSTIRYFTLMSWAKVSSIGCGVAQCSGIYNTVCRYDPAGNIDNTPVYTKGNVCTACPAGFTRCVDSLCTA